MKMLKRQIGKNCKVFLLMLIAAFLLGSIIIQDTSVVMAAGETEAGSEEIESQLRELRYIRIIKVDSSDVNIKLEGAEFELLDSRGEVSSSGTTDENGLLILEGLHPGNNYTLRETKAPEGYEGAELYQGSVKLESGTTLTLYIGNKKPETQYGSVQIVKTDARDEEIRLSGAEFEVRDSEGEVAASGATNGEGSLVLEGLELNKEYVLKETKAPEGYEGTQLFEETFSLTDNETSKTFYVENEKPILPEIRYGYIEIYNVDASDRQIALGGAKFVVINSEGEVVASGTTDAQGYLKLEGLGLNQRFTLKETKAPKGCRTAILYKKEFVLTDGELPLIFEVENQRIEDPKDPKNPEDPKNPKNPKDPEESENSAVNPGNTGGGLQAGGMSKNQTIRPLSFAKERYTPMTLPQTAAANKGAEETVMEEESGEPQAGNQTKVSAPASAEHTVGGSREGAKSIQGILGQYAYIGTFGASVVAAASFGLSIGYDVRTLVWYQEKKKQARRRFKKNRR